MNRNVFISSFLNFIILSAVFLTVRSIFFKSDVPEENLLKAGKELVVLPHELYYASRTPVALELPESTTAVLDHVIDCPLYDISINRPYASIENLVLEQPVPQDNQMREYTTICKSSEASVSPYALTLFIDGQPVDTFEQQQSSTVDGKSSLVYGAQQHGFAITKNIAIACNANIVECHVTLQPLNNTKEAIASIIVPLPCLQDERHIQELVGLVGGANDIENISLKTAHDKVWYQPAQFGGMNRYFIHLMLEGSTFAERAYFKYVQGYGWCAVFESAPITQPVTKTLRFYMGMKDADDFARINAVPGYEDFSTQSLMKTLDYGMLAFLVKGIVRFLKSSLFGGEAGGISYGWRIIILTILMRLLLLLAMLFGNKKGANQAELARKMKLVEQKYKNDPQQLAQEKFNLIRRYGGGVFWSIIPLFVQLAFFLALNTAVRYSVFLYRQPMLWIPDLSQADPYRILPTLVFVVMLLQALNAKQQANRLMMIFMAVLLSLVVLYAPAGVGILLITSAAFGVIQSMYLPTMM